MLWITRTILNAWPAGTMGHMPPSPTAKSLRRRHCGHDLKDLKLKGSINVLKTGTKFKPIRLVDGDHEITCKMDDMAIGLKACFVKKVPA
jgi:hypothetical protein